MHVSTRDFEKKIPLKEKREKNQITERRETNKPTSKEKTKTRKERRKKNMMPTVHAVCIRSRKCPRELMGAGPHNRPVCLKSVYTYRQRERVRVRVRI